jgi:hypothetical protein
MLLINWKETAVEKINELSWKSLAEADENHEEPFLGHSNLPIPEKSPMHCRFSKPAIFQDHIRVF